MTEEFPWTESGLMLLRTIEGIIDENGGRMNYYQIIVAENTSDFVCADSREKMLIKVMKMYGHISIVEMAEILEISVSRTNEMIGEVMERGFIPDTRKINRLRKKYYSKFHKAVKKSKK